tara:strand:- start:1136 stop:1465 length:330 start_codon:yes stop_codon:yes gene_type:complete
MSKEEKKGRNPRTPYHKDCTCCMVHYAWRDTPLPKHEVTIEMISELNKLYRNIYEQFQLEKQHATNERVELSSKYRNMDSRLESLSKAITEYGIFRSIEKLKVGLKGEL